MQLLYKVCTLLQLFCHRYTEVRLSCSWSAVQDFECVYVTFHVLHKAREIGCTVATSFFKTPKQPCASCLMSIFNIEPQNHCLDAGEYKISVPSEIAISVGGGSPPTSDMRWHKIRTFHCALDCTGKMMISSEAITHILFRFTPGNCPAQLHPSSVGFPFVFVVADTGFYI